MGFVIKRRRARVSWWVCAFLATGACQHAVAPGPTATASAPPAECQDALVRARRLGALLFEHDRAAADASDAVQERFGRDERVRGFVTIPGSDGIEVVFYGDAAGRPAILYTVAAGRRVTKHEPPAPPGAEAEIRIRALRTAAAVPLELRCSERQNPVVLPAEPLGERGWLVYFLASTEKAGEMVIGGHVRRLVSEDGSTLVRSEPLSKACLTLPPPPPNARFATATHLVTPCPVETHVLAAFQGNTTIVVHTSTGYWTVKPKAVRAPPSP